MKIPLGSSSRLLLLPVLLNVITLLGTCTPSYAGACPPPPPPEETDSDVLLTEVVSVMDSGTPEENKPIKLRAKVLEVLRGDKNKYASEVVIFRPSRTTVGYCMGPAYSMTRVPKPHERFISAFAGTINGAYTEQFGAYEATPENIREIKTRIKTLSNVTSNFAKEARRVDNLKQEKAAAVFYKSCLAANLNAVSAASTDVVIVSPPTYFMTGIETEMNFTVKERLTDSSGGKALTVERPVFVRHGLYPHRFVNAYKDGAILFLKASPAASNFTPPKDYPNMFKQEYRNTEYQKKTFTYFPAADKLWILPASSEMLSKVKQALRSAPPKRVARTSNWKDPIMQTIWFWPTNWSYRDKKAPKDWRWILSEYDRAFGRDTFETDFVIGNMLQYDKAVPDRAALEARRKRIARDKDARARFNARMTDPAGNHFW